MHRFVGIIGIIVILGICYLMSNNKKAISLKTVLSGLALQFFLAVFILTVPLGQKIINAVAKCIEKILHFANSGGDFVFGFLKSGAEALSNIASAFYIDQYSGHKKNFSLFSKIITGEDETFAQYRQTVPNLIKTGLNLDDNEYIELFHMLKSKKYLSQICDNKIYRVGKKVLNGEKIKKSNRGR